MSRFRTSGIPLRSFGMSVRRVLSDVPVFGRIFPDHWRCSPVQMRTKLDELALRCGNPAGWTEDPNEPVRLWRTLALLCLSEGPDHLPALRVLGYSCFKLERYEESASAYRLLANISRDVEMYTALGFASRNDDERISALQEAIAVDKGDPQSWMNLGCEMAHQERYGDAVGVFEQAMALSKSGTSQDIILYYIGMNLLSSGETEKAMARLIQAVERDQVGAFQEFFDVQIADACVGYEDFALKIYKHVRKSSPEAAARFLSMYARRQKAFELHVKPWEVGSEVLDEALATYGHAS